ncbi:hypothetical protein [Natrialba asiatica]|uniref:Uncharacterized protein n=1 Tax=Natrialba asiatica (strain ATCC 700177 / DSM 12278 / JCM 9576 / FERM P-10747 / NBRC 102637 / 172P1) TaxID=29540 RepID=M0B1U0_NATA1|nr:hypothetical protein [Natrialba asiatica]ELZ04876.1 hypothetical protein C481_03817 [Natrialba asiatica DSM 12278]
MTDEDPTPNSRSNAAPNQGETDGNGEIEIEVTRGETDPSADDSGERRTDSESRAFEESASESDLADELGRIDVMTSPEGYVEGRITDVTPLDATTVELTVSLPHGETRSFTLEKPIPWSEDFLLARLVADIGYDAASIDHIIGEPVYLVRTDVGPETPSTGPRNGSDWWTASMQAASDAILSSLSGGRYRIETTTEPEWQLVDPLDRPDASPTESTDTTADLVGTGLILAGTIIAAAGAVVGATGELVISSSVLPAVMLGLMVVLTGLVVLFRTSGTE